MSLNNNQQNRHLSRFLELLEDCYDGKLKGFSEDFSNFDDTFYEKLKKKYSAQKLVKYLQKKKIALKNITFF